MKRVRIAVTGVGLVTPLGLTSQATWEGLKRARRAAKWLPEETFGPGVCGAAVPLPNRSSRRLVTLAQRAACEAVEQANLKPAELRAASCVIGTSKIDFGHFDRIAQPVLTRQAVYAGGMTAEPHTEFSLWSSEESELDLEWDCHDLSPSGPACAIAGEFGCEGGVFAPVAACATGLVSLIRGSQLIREGVCPVVMAGGADASLHPGLLSSYARLGVMAKPGNDPSRCCRPFDRLRSGFVVGEGAGVLILEDWDHATRRGAQPLAEWVDGRIGSDPSGLTGVDVCGEPLAELIQRLLADCSLSINEIDALGLHGTATPLNDVAEAAAIHRVFGSEATSIPGFSIKGGTGHLMGAAGAVEAAACVLALRDQTVPPTTNLENPDPDCGLNLKGSARRLPLRHVLKTSLGFGGTIAVGLFRNV